MNIQENIKRLLNNLCSSPSFNSVITKEETEAFMDTYALIQFCRGHMRKICFEKITENRFKIYSEEA